MALRGDLASVDLAQVFQMLALNKKVGLLSIQSAKSWKVLYFDQRGVTVHHNVHALIDKVVAALVRTGRLEEDAVEEVRDHSVRMGQSLTDCLLAGGYLDESELDYQYRLELEEEIYDLFFCRDARFEFHENTRALDGREGDIDERFFFNCDSIIMEAARRIDEWAYISERIPSTAEVLVATADEVSAEEYGEDGPSIFELLDGRRNVARVVEITGLTNFQVCKVLSQLLDDGKIAPVEADELVPLANECMDDGRLADAISLYERAIELEIGLPESHSLAAKAYQAAEEYEAAIYHLESEAEHRIGDGDFDGAAHCLYEACRLVPTNLRARERLQELTVGPDAVRIDGYDPIAEGKELVELLTSLGDLPRVRCVLERLLLVEPNDPDLKKVLVNVHLRAGDQKRVIELYESIADDLVRQGKPLEAVSFLQKILVLDRSRSDVSERMRRLYEFDERARRRSRALSVLGVLFCLLLVLGSGYWFYNERAEEDLAAIDVRDLLRHEDFAGAEAVFRQFIEQHPLTTAVGKAEAELQNIASAQQLFEARRKAERAAREAELNKLRDRYKAEWNRHREHLAAGRPEAAFAAVAKVRELLQQANGAADTEWALEQQVENTWKNLRAFLAEARRLGQIYDEKVKAADWAGARQVALRLQDEFEDTEAGRRVLVPVVVVTRPAGATLLHDGAPLTRTVDGRVEPVTTPGLVLCHAGSPVRLTAQLAGFAPREIVVDGRNDARIEVVLEVVPARVIAFEHPVLTGVGIGGGWLAAGLRGGRLGFARVDGTNRQELELGGLKEVAAAPVVQRGRVFFVSNERTIESVPVSADAGGDAWSVQLEHDAATPLCAADGRLAVVDRKNVLHCWEQASGRRLWGSALGSAASGPPVIAHRRAYVGTTDGRVLVFDAANGRSLGVLRSPAGLTTRLHVDRDLLVFGCGDDTVRSVDFRQGKVLWSETLGRAPSDAGMALARRVVVIADQGRVVAHDRSSGKQLGALPTDDTVVAMVVDGDRVLLQLRRSNAPRKGSHDVLVACALDSMDVLWEYALGEDAPGAFGVDDVIALPSSTGEVMLFDKESAR